MATQLKHTTGLTLVPNGNPVLRVLAWDQRADVATVLVDTFDGGYAIQAVKPTDVRCDDWAVNELRSRTRLAGHAGVVLDEAGQLV